jgi:beta-lactamase class A
MLNQHKILRVLKLISYLEQSPSKTIGHLAEILESTERTVYRYFDLIRECGFDLQRDEHNRFYIVDDRSNGVRFTDEEAKFLNELILTYGNKNKLKDSILTKIYLGSEIQMVASHLVNAKNANTTMRKMGARDIQVRRGVEDTKAFNLNMNNSVTAYDLLLIFEQIARKKVVDKKASEAMTQILFDQKFNEVIPAHLPKNVKVAHKTGSITGVQHDSGIVFLPDGRTYVLVVLSKKLTNTKAGVKALAEVSEMIYNFIK